MLNVARLLLLSACLIAVTVFAQAQPDPKPFKPQLGQDGKDVIWMPTPAALANKMLDLASVTPNDYVIDLGSGDGRMVIAAAKRGAHALGIEYNPDMVELARRNAARAGVADKATFMTADLYDADLSRATVITLFLLPEINLKLRPKLLALKPGTRIVSNSFGMGDWPADRSAESADETYHTALLWIVPARVAGSWQLPQGELTLTQQFQRVSGTLGSGTNARPIANGRLRGDHISFTAGTTRFSGRIAGNAMAGSVKTGSAASNWSGTRASRLVAGSDEPSTAPRTPSPGYVPAARLHEALTWFALAFSYRR